ncbi:MAG: MerC domain-containing protein [Flavobacteriales bacterium]|nr:MAG: MerC domain-containing protein [Flavobacteriales bacterium]
MKSLLKSSTLDKVGMTASITCAIHCAALPFFLTLLPLWGLEFLATPFLEMSMILLSLILGVWSLSKSYRQIHRNPYPIITLACGFMFILIGHLSEIDLIEPILIPVGGFTIAGAHFLNLKLSRSCKHHH